MDNTYFAVLAIDFGVETNVLAVQNGIEEYIESKPGKELMMNAEAVRVDCVSVCNFNSPFGKLVMAYSAIIATGVSPDNLVLVDKTNVRTKPDRH